MSRKPQTRHCGSSRSRYLRYLRGKHVTAGSEKELIGTTNDAVRRRGLAVRFATMFALICVSTWTIREAHLPTDIELRAAMSSQRSARRTALTRRLDYRQPNAPLVPTVIRGWTCRSVLPQTLRERHLNIHDRWDSTSIVVAETCVNLSGETLVDHGALSSRWLILARPTSWASRACCALRRSLNVALGDRPE